MGKDWRPFGELFRKLRNQRGNTQAEIAAELGIPPTTLSMIEKGKRPPPEREKLIAFIQSGHIWPSEGGDELLRLADSNSARSPREELNIQQLYPFVELIVFAHTILEPDGGWYDTVLNNLSTRRIKYTYFTSNAEAFSAFLEKLISDKGLDLDTLKARLQCFVLPEELFVSNFALYRHLTGVYCCATERAKDGRATSFFTNDTDGNRLWDQLDAWRSSILQGNPILLAGARSIFPVQSASPFQSLPL